MLLKKLVIENLRSYSDQEVVFPRGSTLLSGDIGSGKTTILLAIEFALFGIQPSQKAASLLRNDRENARVVLEFEIDNKDIIIERKLKRGKKSVTQDYVSIIVDGEKFEESVTEIKAKVLELLNYPKEFSKKTNLLYKFTVYTPQEEMKQIVLESGETRLNILRHVFGIDKYKRIQDNASILTSRLREKIRINSALYQDLDVLRESVILKKKELKESKEKLGEIESKYNESLNEVKLREDILEETMGKINEKRSLENEKSKVDMLLSEKNLQIKDVNGKIDVIKQQIVESEKLKFNVDEYNSINERIRFQKDKLEGLQKELMDVIGRIKSSEAKDAEARLLIRKISGLDKCPTCLQEVSSSYKDNILDNANNEIERSRRSADELIKKKSDLNEKIDVVRRLIDGFENKKSEMDFLKIRLENIKEKDRDVLNLEGERSTLVLNVEEIMKKIGKINESIKEFEKYDVVFMERDKELKEAKIKERELSVRRAEISKDIEFIEEQIKEKQENVDKKELLKNKTKKMKELEFWISEKFLEIVLFTEKQIMITLKEKFSKLFSKWFSILVSENLSARLGDDFSPIIEQKDYELDYEFLSGGERTAIALAYRLSLNQVINSILSNIKTSNLVILDEPTDGFSAQQLDKMRDVLSQLEIDQLILVSHEQRMEDFVDNIIKIDKVDGVSRVDGV
ncbi:hypothetical protein CMI42_04120 [Candidatus Pacearchaeota archaeon]|nr:hypothetical protein [Candidatus Pacearchaeota archaeon]|tara:strand:- start:1196 stop:3250 length:2055 start_codon:yes stop_codon:yes gene_type:complete